MNRIDKIFRQLKEKNRKAFIVYITAGDPDLEDTLKLVLEMEKRGVTHIELGIPYSDPVADGPVNQDAAARALKNRVSIEDVCGLVRKIREKSEIPIILFTYLNPVFNLGFERFARLSADSGVDGALILDFPPEESEEFKSFMSAQNIRTIFIIAPTTRKERMKYIAKNCTGFVYYVSRMGVTGDKNEVDTNTSEAVKLIKSCTDLPVCVGFCISTPEHVRNVASVSDGVIVGSAIVRRIGRWAGEPDYIQRVGDFVGELIKPILR